MNKGLFLFLQTILLYIYSRYILKLRYLKNSGNALLKVTEQFIPVLENMGYSK